MRDNAQPELEPSDFMDAEFILEKSSVDEIQELTSTLESQESLNSALQIEVETLREEMEELRGMTKGGPGSSIEPSESLLGGGGLGGGNNVNISSLSNPQNESRENNRVGEEVKVDASARERIQELEVEILRIEKSKMDLAMKTAETMEQLR